MFGGADDAYLQRTPSDQDVICGPSRADRGHMGPLRVRTGPS